MALMRTFMLMRPSAAVAVRCFSAATDIFAPLGQPLGAAKAPKAKKVTVIGAGSVGIATAYSILNQGAASNLTLIDINADRVIGEATDLMHGSAFFPRRVTVHGSADLAASEESDLVIVTSGVRQSPGESRLNLLARNVDVFKSMLPKIAAANPHQPPICIVTNPCDIMTRVAAQILGYPAGRVFGSGTSLDSSRFRTLIAERLGVDARSVHALIVGEHGDSSVACWSTLHVSGVNLRALKPLLGTEKDPEAWTKVHDDVINAAYSVIKAKGYTNWAIGMACAHLAEVVLRGDRRVLPVSVAARGHHGIAHDVYLSLPAVLTSTGVESIANIVLDADETRKLRSSADVIAATQAQIKV